MVFHSLHQKWGHNPILAFELAMMGHLMFPRGLDCLDTRLLILWEQIESGHTFAPALLVNTFRALNLARATRSPSLECCISLLQVWVLEHLIACWPLITRGLFQEDLIHAHIRRTSSSSFKSEANWTVYLKNLRSE